MPNRRRYLNKSDTERPARPLPSLHVILPLTAPAPLRQRSPRPQRIPGHSTPPFSGWVGICFFVREPIDRVGFGKGERRTPSIQVLDFIVRHADGATDLVPCQKNKGIRTTDIETLVANAFDEFGRIVRISEKAHDGFAQHSGEEDRSVPPNRPRNRPSALKSHGFVERAYRRVWVCEGSDWDSSRCAATMKSTRKSEAANREPAGACSR